MTLLLVILHMWVFLVGTVPDMVRVLHAFPFVGLVKLEGFNDP